MQTNPAVEQNKNVKWSESVGFSPVDEEKVCGGKDLPKSQVLSSEWKTEQVKEDENGESEDGKDAWTAIINYFYSAIFVISSYTAVISTVGRGREVIVWKQRVQAYYRWLL